MDKPNVQYAMQKMREIRSLLTPMEAGAEIDVEKCLAVVAEVRAWIPERDRSPEPLFEQNEGRLDFSPVSETEFDYQIVLEAIETLLAEIQFAQARNLARGVQAYYAIEDDPEQVAELKDEIESLQRTYRAVYGKPIPPNPNKKKKS